MMCPAQTRDHCHAAFHALHDQLVNGGNIGGDKSVQRIQSGVCICASTVVQEG